MKIDLHTHILPEKWPDLAERFGYPGWIRLDHHSPCRARMMIGDRLFREIEDNCWSPQRRIEDCGRSGVDVQVLSTVPVLFSYWAKPEHTLELSKLLNDHIAGVVRDEPRRFRGLGTIPMQDAALACRELERCVLPPRRGGLGLAGVEIGTNVNGKNLSDASLREVFSAAEQLGAAVFVHPWDMAGKERMSQYWLAWLVGMPAETALAICSMILGGVLERYPRLRVCFSHGGGSFPGTIGRIAHGCAVRPDLCAVDCSAAPLDYLARAAGPVSERSNAAMDLRAADGPSGASGSVGNMLRPARFWVDSLVHDAGALRTIVGLFGPQRVALGSDYPFPLGEATPGALIESMADFDADVKRWLLAGAAQQFLGETAG